MTRWVLLGSVWGMFAAACGDDGNSGQLADAPFSVDAARIDGAAPATDAAADAAPDAAPLRVTVTVTLGGVAAPGQTVYFQSHDSAATDTQTTDARGDASSLVEAGGYVTVIDPEAPPAGLIGPTSHLTTFAAVKPGDHLFVDVPTGASGAAVGFTVTVPNEELGYNYTLFSSCGSAFIGTGSAPPVPQRRARKAGRAAAVAALVTSDVQLFGCHGTADLLVVGTDSDNIVRSWIYQPSTALVERGTIALTGYQSPVNVDFSYPNVPGDRDVDVRRELRTARGSLYVTQTTAFGDIQNTVAPGFTASATVAMPDPTGALAITTSTVASPRGISQHAVLAWGANTSYSLDFEVALAAYNTFPSADAASRAILWTQTPGGQAPDFVIARYHNARTENETTHDWTWELVGPYAAAPAPALVYPVLPTELLDFNLRATDEPFVERLTTVQVPGGYDAARAHVFAGDLAGAVTGATGQIVFEDQSAGGGLARKIPATLPRGRFTPRAR